MNIKKSLILSILVFCFTFKATNFSLKNNDKNPKHFYEKNNRFKFHFKDTRSSQRNFKGKKNK